MFMLYKVNDDSYVVVRGNGFTFEGGRDTVIKVLRGTGCNDDEIGLGLDALDTDNFQSAVYHDNLFVYCRRHLGKKAG